MDFGVSRFPNSPLQRPEPDDFQLAADEEAYNLAVQLDPLLSRFMDLCEEGGADPDDVRGFCDAWRYFEDLKAHYESRWLEIDGRRSLDDKPLALEWDHPMASQWCTRDGKGVVEINEDGTFLAKYRSHYAYGEYLKVIADDQDQFIDFSTLKDAQRRVEQELALI